ncbi:hypothetical protein D9756_007545 [Leucocoprinus leucothites]|uniref:G1/S-specific cyclin pas1 n=1 Tax=Leucocoprinus leucothites TaxID=201217 RepID=A0A8H5D1E5_9AGAR|nr:hypothetical protein D9756_007545 [Leucoagaricus leucothites]
MHAFAHSLAHRAPSATRPRVRWQPYNPLSSQSSSSSLSTSSPSSTQISTPSTSISSPPSNTLPEPKLSHTSQNQKDAPPLRDNSKKQFAVGLVDQAVKTLGEIWRPQDIPPAFLTTSRAGPALGSPQEHLSNSLISLSSSLQSGCVNDARTIVPIKGFVHEVIRRSRTSGCVLQTALCYLEAIRPRIPDLLQKEKSGEGVHGDADISGRILPATELELKLEEEYHQLEMCGLETASVLSSPDLAPTIRVTDLPPADCPSEYRQETPPSRSKQHSPPSDVPIPSISALPSPLLCPRRAFLASLILASKFTQDKCYSNRAWAKLSGLPAREISRSERALGEALDWRLWVGKTPVQSSLASGPSPTGTTTTSNRPVVRSQSESNILSMPATRSPFLVRQDPRPLNVNPISNRVLQRSSTLPAEVFTVLPSYRTGASTCRNTQETLEPTTQPPVPSQIGSAISYADGLSQSPSPDIPGLSYSPSSTESSSGDRTIQMSTFIDEPMVTYSVPQAPTATDFWPGSDTNDVQEFRTSPSAYMKSNRVGKAPAAPDNLGFYALPAAVTSADFMTAAYPLPVSNYPWLLDGENFRSLPLVGQ